MPKLSESVSSTTAKLSLGDLLKTRQWIKVKPTVRSVVTRIQRETTSKDDAELEINKLFNFSISFESWEKNLKNNPSEFLKYLVTRVEGQVKESIQTERKEGCLVADLNRN